LQEKLKPLCLFLSVFRAFVFFKEFSSLLMMVNFYKNVYILVYHRKIFD